MSRPQCPRCHRAFLPGLYEMHIRGCGTAQERASLTEWCAFVRSSPGGLGTPDHLCPCDKLQSWIAQRPAPARDDLTYALVYSVRHSQQDACELLLAAGADINGSVPATPLNMGIINGEEMARFVLLKGGRVCSGEVHLYNIILCKPSIYLALVIWTRL
jgi:hypothetical protein